MYVCMYVCVCIWYVSVRGSCIVAVVKFDIILIYMYVNARVCVCERGFMYSSFGEV